MPVCATCSESLNGSSHDDAAMLVLFHALAGHDVRVAVTTDVVSQSTDRRKENVMTAALAQPIRRESGWQTIEAPELFKFEKPGTTVSGKLISLSKVRVNNKDVMEYMIADGEKRFRLLGTFDLLQKLTRAHIGCEVRIMYRGENPEVEKNGNKLKVFDVQFKGTPADVSHGPAPITDEDIPF
jgi:hypothetical protein